MKVMHGSFELLKLLLIVTVGSIVMGGKSIDKIAAEILDTVKF